MKMSCEGDNLSCSTTDWRIPRPLLYTSGSGSNSSIGTSNYERNIRCIYTAELASDQKLDSINIDIPSGENWFSSGSSTSSNSTSSSRSGSSGALLLTASNLDRLKHEPISVKPSDTQSIASSTHFTLVNGVTVSRKPLSECCWKNHQLPVLVISMTIILFFGILAAVIYVEIRAMELRQT